MTRDEIILMADICQRYERMSKEMGARISDRITRMMDLEAAHNQHPLRLADLLAADDLNFIHDVSGIHHNINRETGMLENCFLPRFTK